MIDIRGYRIQAAPSLRPPRLERSTFSGGRNLSAIARNNKLMSEARKVYVMHAERLIIVPAWYAPEFIARLDKALRKASP